MPRKIRITSSTGVYHIILRSVNQHIIFEDSEDYIKFLCTLSDCKSKYNIDILAYCLMNNHIHLLIHSQDGSPANFFQSVGAKFVLWYNTKYSRVGHLFQDRYRSVVIEDAQAYLSVLGYINYNPVKAGICRSATEYLWSSCRAFYGQKDMLVDTSFSYAIAGSKEDLLSFFSIYDYEKNQEMNWDNTQSRKHPLTDEQAINEYKKISGLSSLAEAAHLNKIERNHLVVNLAKNQLSQKQISRIMNVSLATVKRILTKQK